MFEIEPYFFMNKANGNVDTSLQLDVGKASHRIVDIKILRTS